MTHALAQDELTRLRDVTTELVALRKGLVRLGRLCGYEIIDARMEPERVEIETPLTATTGERLTGLPDVVIVADPMLATGSTMAAVLAEVLAAGATPANTIVLSAVSTPPGLKRLRESVPDVELVTVAVDGELNEDGYIVPVLGGASDRAFRTT